MLYKLFFISLFLLLSYTSYSQFTGYGDDQDYQSGIWIYNLDTLPPIRDDMSYWTKFSYNYIDSLSTVINDNRYILFIKDTLLDIDSIKFFTAMNYFVKSYDDILFDCYNIETNRMTLNNIKYKTYPVTWFSYYLIAYLHHPYIINKIGKNYAYVAFMPDIYHIRIDSVVIGRDTTFYSQGDTNEYIIVNVSATILDIIKGKEKCNCKIHNNGNISNFVNDTSKKNCLNFVYLKDKPTNYGFLGLVNTNTTIKTVNKGEEYIAFLKTAIIDTTIDDIGVDTRYDVTGGLFEVTNGYVNDMSNLFYQGDGTLCPLDSFIAIIKGKMKTVESWINIPSTSVKEYSQNNSLINIFPNPVSDYLSIDTKDIYYNQLINIYNIYGQKILECPYSDKIDVSNLLPGAYYFCLADKVIKFIKK